MLVALSCAWGPSFSSASRSIRGLGTSGENKPAVEHGSSASAATAGADAEGVSDVLDDIAEAHVFIGNKPGQPHAVRTGFVLRRIVVPRLSRIHSVNPSSFDTRHRHRA